MLGYPVRVTTEPMSKSQKIFIKSICQTIGVEFTGSTKYEATQFIKEHIDEYEFIQECMYDDIGWNEFLNG